KVFWSFLSIVLLICPWHSLKKQHILKRILILVPPFHLQVKIKLCSQAIHTSQSHTLCDKPHTHTHTHTHAHPASPHCHGTALQQYSSDRDNGDERRPNEARPIVNRWMGKIL